MIDKCVFFTVNTAEVPLLYGTRHFCAKWQYLKARKPKKNQINAGKSGPWAVRPQSRGGWQQGHQPEPAFVQTKEIQLTHKQA